MTAWLLALVVSGGTADIPLVITEPAASRSDRHVLA